MPRMPRESRPTRDETSDADLRSVLRNAILKLERERVPSAPLAAELLLMHALGHDRVWIYAHSEHRLDVADYKKYFTLIEQRSGGVPTQHLTGHQEFWGLEFEVTPDVLIPRPETEHLIEVALERLGINMGETSERRRSPYQIADVGTGSGCIAVALARELPEARIVATDISQAALKVASRNAEHLGVASQIQFTECNLLDAFDPRVRISNRQVGREAPAGFDLIVSNPPYIGRWEAVTLPREVREHEPEAALFGGEKGTELYKPLIAQAGRLLRPGGSLAIELGHTSSEHVSQLLETAEWADAVFTKDLAGIQRVVSARRTSK